MELRELITLFRKWAWLVALGAILAGVAAYAASQFMQPVYQATSTLLIDSAPGDTTSNYTDILASERLTRTYAELITTRPVLEEVITQLELDVPPEQLQGHIQVSPVRDTQLIGVSVEDTDPLLAAGLANTVAQVFQEQNEALQSSRFASSKQSLAAELNTLNQQIIEIQSAIETFGEPSTSQQEVNLAQLQDNLYQLRLHYISVLQSYEQLRLAEAQSTSNVVIVEQANLPGFPIRPRPARNTALAALVGLMLSSGVALFIEYLDDSLKSPEQITSMLGLPVLGVIARLPGEQIEQGPITAAEPRSPVAEAYRALRTNIESMGDEQLRSVLVTSASPGEGKSITAANLAIVLAQAGLHVVLLDCDLRRPTAHRIFDLPNRRGLSNLVLKPPKRENGLLKTTSVENLNLLTSGPLPSNPAEMLNTQRMAEIIEELHSHADFVVVDSPPIAVVTDAAILARHVDGVLFVTDAGVTRIGAARRALEQLERVGANVLGAIVNRASPQHGNYYYNYYYYQAYGEDHNPDNQNLLSRRKRSKKRSKSRANGSTQSKSAKAEESSSSK